MYMYIHDDLDIVCFAVFKSEGVWHPPEQVRGCILWHPLEQVRGVAPSGSR